MEWLYIKIPDEILGRFLPNSSLTFGVSFYFLTHLDTFLHFFFPFQLAPNAKRFREILSFFFIQIAFNRGLNTETTNPFYPGSTSKEILQSVFTDWFIDDVNLVIASYLREILLRIKSLFH